MVIYQEVPESEYKSDITLEKVAMDYIADFEGVRLKSYWDAKGFSIGYGTPSFAGEVITIEEAKKRKLDHIYPILKLSDNECYSENERIAVTSFMYNVGINALGIKNYVLNCDKKSILYVMNNYGWTINGVYSTGLAKRRTLEINKFNEK